jgi:hypothetical protein
MRKKLIPALIILLSLPLSCSELILPKNVNVHGTVDLSIKIMADNWGTAVAKILKEAFIGNADKIEMIDFDADVFDVNYGQEEQTFLISIHSEITNHLNPAEYLKDAAAFLYHVGTSDEFDISYNIDTGFLEEQDLTVLNQTISVVPVPVDINVPAISLSKTLSLEHLSDGFLHASIEDGNMNIVVKLLDVDTALDSSLYEITYKNISVTQAPKDSYNGLSCPIGSLHSTLLHGQDINSGEINLDGSVEITIKAGATAGLSSDELTLSIIVKMEINKLEEVDWDFTKIQNELNGHQIDPVSLANVTPYVNYIDYEAGGIGLQFKFTKMIDGLAMSVVSEALGIEENFQELKQDVNIIYANDNPGTLWLNGPTPPMGHVPFSSTAVDRFDFFLMLKPSGGNANVLHIEPLDGIVPGDLGIEGTAEFFQDWREAQINLDKIIKAAPDSIATGFYEKRIPSVDNDPIDLSVLTDYITGFSFGDIRSDLHVNGPEGVVVNMEDIPTLALWADYWNDPHEDHPPMSIYNEGALTMDKHSVSLTASDFNANGSYTKRDLPPNGIPFNFTDILEAQPKNLVFSYRVSLPHTLTVTHDLFLEESTIIDSKITVTILIMLPLKLTVKGSGPGMITFPDMFDGGKDLFGRDSLEEDSVFNSFDIDYLRFSVDFTGTFFRGGKLFIEKAGKEKLFPSGITLDGRKFELKVTGADFETIKNNLIDPDLRLIFANPGSMLNVPRNIGLTNIKVEARGKFDPKELSGL